MRRPESKTGSFPCPTCGTALDAGRLEGLCPVCIWRSLSEQDAESAAIASPAPGLLRIPGYLVLEEISRGGMGIVYRARQSEPPRDVALKMLLPHQLGSAEARERFRVEVRTIGSLDHPCILPVYQVGECDGMPFFAMKYASGGTLAARAGRYHAHPREIAVLIAQVADAVQFAHERGVLHRDIKPGNVLFDQEGHAYVSDFGLAKLVSDDTALTLSADILGTPHYLAPEVAANGVRLATTASDVYGLGTILYELLAGRRPFEAEGVPALLRKIADEDPAALPASVPRDLEVICFKCLAKEPGERFASAGKVAEDLRRWLAGKPVTARPVSRSEQVRRWAGRNPKLAVTTAALVLTLLAGSLEFWQSNRRVRTALTATQKAEYGARQSLHEALLSQAQALGTAHGMGQRWRVLEVLGRAANIGPSLALRNEAAAALARADLRELVRFPASFGMAGSPVVFSSDLLSYVSPEPAGGFSHRTTKDQALLASFPGSSGKPALWFVLSPDDRHVAALLDDYTLEVWPLDGKNPKLTWEGNVQQPPVAEFHPDGNSLAGYVQSEGLFLQGLDGRRRRLVPDGGRVIYLRFDPHGERLAVARDNPGVVELWRCTGVPALLWRHALPRVVPWLSWSPHADKIAAAADDGRGVRVLSAPDGQVELTYSRHLMYPRQFEFAPDGRVIASVGQDWVLRLWDARSGQDLVTGVGRHRVMRFSRDGRRLTTALNDRELSVLELAPERIFREFTSTPSDSGIDSYGLTRTADGRLLLAANPYPRLYETDTGAEVAMPASWPATDRGAVLDPSGQAIFYSRPGEGVFRRSILRSASAGGGLTVRWGDEELAARRPKSFLWTIADGGASWISANGDGLELWPQRDPTRALRIHGHFLPRQAATSENGRWAAAANRARDAVEVWDFQTGRVAASLPARNPIVLRFSPDSRWLVAKIETGYCAWRTADWQPAASWEARLVFGDDGEVAFDAAARTVAVRYERDDFRLLTFPEGRELVTLKAPIALRVHSACLSPDGTRLWLLASGYRVFEWNLAELRVELRRLGLDWAPAP